jgi:hypothetical protein
MPLDANQETPQNTTSEESEQPSPIETAALEEAANRNVSRMPRMEGTPIMKVNSSS